MGTRGSNPRPLDHKACALPAESTGPGVHVYSLCYEMKMGFTGILYEYVIVYNLRYVIVNISNGLFVKLGKLQMAT